MSGRTLKCRSLKTLISMTEYYILRGVIRVTKIWKITEADLTDDSKQTALLGQLEEIKIAFTYGEIIGIPTETVYGLAADARNSEAINKIFSAKGRPGDNPLIIHIHDIRQLEDFTSVLDERVIKLMEAFWPGPISFILPLTGDYLSSNAVAELDSVAVRMPSHPVGRRILQHADMPLAAPSANISGKPSPTNAQHVIDDLEDRLYGVVDSESAIYGIESTVLDCTQYPYRIARPGAVTKEELEEVLETIVDTVSDQTDKPISPGMKYKHYAPKGDLHLVVGDEDKVVEKVCELTNEKTADGFKVGIIATEETKAFYEQKLNYPGQVVIMSIGTRKDEDTIAHNLFDLLRRMDAEAVEYIYSESFGDVTRGQAIMNRLLKAAGYQQIRV